MVYISDKTTPRHISNNPEPEISCVYIVSKTEKKVKLIENYKTFKLTSLM
jgi:hypothetical protein